MPGKHYIVYLPEGGEVKVNLSDARGVFKGQWIHPVEGTSYPAPPVEGGALRSLKAPFEGHAVAVLKVV